MASPDENLRAAILAYARAAMDRPLHVSPPPESTLPFEDPGLDAALSSVEADLLDILGHQHVKAFRGLLSDAAARGRVGDATKHGPADRAATLFLVPIQGPQLLLGEHLTALKEYGSVGEAVGRFWPTAAGGMDGLLPLAMTVKALELASPRAIRTALDAARREAPTDPIRGLGPKAIQAVRTALGAEASDALQKRSTARGQPLEFVNRPEMRAIIGIRFLASEAEAPWTIPPDVSVPAEATPPETAWRAWADQRYAHLQIEMDPPRSWSSGCATAAARHAMLLINHRWRTQHGLTVVDVIRGGGIEVMGAGDTLKVTLNCNGATGPVETPACLALMDPPRFRTELFRLSGAHALKPKASTSSASEDRCRGRRPSCNVTVRRGDSERRWGG